MLKKIPYICTQTNLLLVKCAQSERSLQTRARRFVLFTYIAFIYYIAFHHNSNSVVFREVFRDFSIPIPYLVWIGSCLKFYCKPLNFMFFFYWFPLRKRKLVFYLILNEMRIRIGCLNKTFYFLLSLTMRIVLVSVDILNRLIILRRVQSWTLIKMLNRYVKLKSNWMTKMFSTIKIK